MVERLKELRSKFTSRTEAIRVQTILKPKETSSEEEDEEETEISKTEEGELQLDVTGPDPSTKRAPWWQRYPNRRLVIRQPLCTACVAPHRKHFMAESDKPLVRVENTSKQKEPVPTAEDQNDQYEIIGQELFEAWECSCPIPAWIPGPKVIFASSFSPYSAFYLFWLMCLTFAVLYNFVTIPLREAFDIYDEDYRFYWYIGNAISDGLYLLDMIIVRPRMEFIENGLITTDFKSCARHYVKSTQFKCDIVSVLPLDLCSLFYQQEMARFRILRIFKVYTFWETFDRLDQRLNAGFAVRLARTIIYMIYIIHLESCGYYAFNRWQGMEATTWSIPVGNISPYVYSFYVCMKTATSIGSLPAATNPLEFLFMTCYWLSGIFVSAILIGQIIDILDSASSNKDNYRKIMDATLSCMHHLHAPVHVVDKVRTWFMYNWEQQKTFDENSLLDTLPIKLKSDLTISVHFNTLSKVTLFQNCERALIYDMILKLKPVVFLPMDYICRKGEVGKEMYIVKSGIVEVVGGPNNSVVFVTLKEGSVFGEISLLAISGKNRRTADVRSKGFSTLFSLSKEDFEEIMKNYPQAHHLLKKRSQRMLNRDKKKAKEEEKARKLHDSTNDIELPEDEVVEVIPERPPTPRLVDTVAQALEVACPEKLATQNWLHRRSRNSSDWRRSSYRRPSFNTALTNQRQLSEAKPEQNSSTNKESVERQAADESVKANNSDPPSYTDQCESDKNVPRRSTDEDQIAELDSEMRDNWYRRLELKRRPWSGIQTYLVRRW
ncbi:Cyclic nucleotide gated cation channel [Fasciola gigantica]|uniref:Cyclic nucleotide gated cation channel n=1 Tax=Fasciola gigantica TaxID=46835 RepID=A0A504YBV8_FASGI|nr:Cyclic nucleotide gated cation channel [Fasciola gigantica]